MTSWLNYYSEASIPFQSNIVYILLHAATKDVIRVPFFYIQTTIGLPVELMYHYIMYHHGMECAPYIVGAELKWRIKCEATRRGVKSSRSVASYDVMIYILMFALPQKCMVNKGAELKWRSKCEAARRGVKSSWQVASCDVMIYILMFAPP